MIKPNILKQVIKEGEITKTSAYYYSKDKITRMKTSHLYNKKCNWYICNYTPGLIGANFVKYIFL